MIRVRASRASAQNWYTAVGNDHSITALDVGDLDGDEFLDVVVGRSDGWIHWMEIVNGGLNITGVQNYNMGDAITDLRIASAIPEPGFYCITAAGKWTGWTFGRTTPILSLHSPENDWDNKRPRWPAIRQAIAAWHLAQTITKDLLMTTGTVHKQFIPTVKLAVYGALARPGNSTGTGLPECLCVFV